MNAKIRVQHGKFHFYTSAIRNIFFFFLIILSFIGCTKKNKDFNVILISIDTLRADYLNIYGYTKYKTSPYIDTLANEGILHVNHIAASPWTTPSHMSLLTSMHPSRHGVIQSLNEMIRTDLQGKKFNTLAEERMTLAEVLMANGYATGAFTGGISMDPRIGFEQGFSLYTSSMYKMNESNMEEMLQWMDEKKDGPFFLFWHTFEVHSPYLIGDLLDNRLTGLRHEIDKLKGELGKVESLNQHIKVNRIEMELLKEFGAYNVQVSSTLYSGGIQSADRWIGKLVTFLKKNDLYDRTLIVLTSDHGEEFADHDPKEFYDSHGHSAYEEMIRVPLIVKLPMSRHSGLRIHSLTRAIDVMPTILETLNIELGKNEMQGESMVPLWKGKDGSQRLAFTEGSAHEPEVKSLRTDRYKYIVYISPETVLEHGRTFVPSELSSQLLFDLQTDPNEKINLLSDMNNQSKITDIKKSLEKGLRSEAAIKRGRVGEVELDEETIRKLKALGYIQ